MAIIHKLVDDGAEGYLPFMLARERVIRNRWGDSFKSHTIKYELGDVTAELRMVGNQSFIRLEVGKGTAGGEWVAYSAEPDLRVSVANRVGKTNGPEGTQRPVPPPYPQGAEAPVEPVFDISRFKIEGGGAHPSFQDIPTSPPVYENNYDEHYQNKYTTGEESGKRLRKLIEENPWFTPRPAPAVQVGAWDDQANKYVVEYRLWDGVGRRFTVKMTEAQYDGQGGLILGPQPYLSVTYTYDPANDWYIQFVEWLMTDYFAYSQAFRGWLQSGEALYQQYQQTLIQWTNDVLKPWEAINLPSQVCPPYFTDLLPKQRSGRAAQIIALNNELAKGIKSISVFGPAMRPSYVPREEPQDPFVNGSGGEWIGPGVVDPITGIRGPSRYDGTTSRVEDIIATSALDTCDATEPAIRYTNAYIGDMTQPLAVNTIQGFGQRLNGIIRRKEPEVPGGIVGTPMANYIDWIESERRVGQGTVSFDLLYGPSVGEVYIAMFEFYAYDAYTEQWQWIPTPSLLEYDWQPINQCYLTCVSYPDHDREAIYKNRPLHGTSTAMRSRRFIKHTRSANGEWSDAITIQAPVITLDVTGQNYFFPSMFVAVRGVQTWMLPKDPYPTTAVDAKFMAKQSISAPFTGGYADTMTWLHAQCLSRFNIPFN